MILDIRILVGKEEKRHEMVKNPSLRVLNHIPVLSAVQERRKLIT